jgi:cell division protein FtsW
VRPVEYNLLLTVTLCLLAFGATMVYSASSARDVLSGGGNGSAMLTRYVLYGAAGLVLLHTLARRRLDWVRQVAPVMLLISFGLMLAVMVPGVGVEVNGARRWLGAGPLQFQPSELMKLSLLLFAVQVIATDPERLKTFKGLLNPLLWVSALACGVVAVHDLGTALVMAATLAVLLVVGGVPMRLIGFLAAGAGALVLLLVLAEPYRVARMTAFLHPWDDPTGAGFQAVQGQIALGSGGLFGVGIGQSVQKVFYLPEAHTDFILAVIGEELGIMGVTGVLALYGALAWGGLRAARGARDRYAKLLATGLTALILSQALLNVCAVLGMVPLTGVPLPFISYGSSNLLVMLASVGLLLNVAQRRGVGLRAVKPRNTPGTGRTDGAVDSDRGRRDGGARRAGAGGRGRAAG